MTLDWASAMEEVCARAIVESCPVTDLQFTSGHRIEVRVALSKLQKITGLSALEDLDMGMLFFYDVPTYAPFTMAETAFDLDIGHYTSDGRLIQAGTHKAYGNTLVTCPQAFSYVLEMPAGTLPAGDFRIL